MAEGMYIGTKKVTDMYVGNKRVLKVYVGNKKAYEYQAPVTYVNLTIGGQNKGSGQMSGGAIKLDTSPSDSNDTDYVVMGGYHTDVYHIYDYTSGSSVDRGSSTYTFQVPQGTKIYLFSSYNTAYYNNVALPAYSNAQELTINSNTTITIGVKHS